MDITVFFSQNNKTVKNTNKIKQLISEYTSNKTIDMLECTYLLNFIKGNGTIININWFVDIANKINEKSFYDECIKINDELFLIENGKLRTDIKKITYNITQIKNYFEYSNDQCIAINNVMNFLADYEQKTFGLYGYAGTGKTTTIVELTSYLIKNGYIKSIAYTAPTNKAVNIIKAKFRYHLKNIVESKTCIKFGENHSMEDMLDILYKKGIKIEFITIHRLLNYKNDFDVDGERIFIQKGETNIKDYQLVIIDECSMIPFDIIKHLLEDIRQADKNIGNNIKKTPKLLFTGDRAQLNAVNELTNVLFNYDPLIVKKILEQKDDKKGFVIINKDDSVALLENDIKKMKFTIMKEVMRSKVDNIINLCINVRQWLEKEIKYPEPRKYTGNGVSIYKYDSKKRKTDSKWFKEYLKNFNNKENTLQTSNIILTWTNKQCDDYNNTVRRIIFKNKKIIDKFEKGDILMLNDFYNMDETKFKLEKEKDNKNRFYTSEQIKVISVEKTIKKCIDFTENLPKSLKKLKNINVLENKFKNITNGLNSKTTRKYEIWKLCVNRLTESYTNEEVETHYINVIHENSNKLLNDEKLYCANIIKNFRKSLISEHNDQPKTIDRIIIRQLWRDWSKIFMEPFAKVNYGCSITTHKSQSSTYVNAFIDVNDILLNNSDEEAKRCLYTALTRASKQVYLLV